jgi:hypothetical protein
MSKIKTEDEYYLKITKSDFSWSDTASTYTTNGIFETNPEKILESLDIKDIEKYLRKKKIQNLKKEEGK